MPAGMPADVPVGWYQYPEWQQLYRPLVLHFSQWLLLLVHKWPAERPVQVPMDMPTEVLTDLLTEMPTITLTGIPTETPTVQTEQETRPRRARPGRWQLRQQ